MGKNKDTDEAKRERFSGSDYIPTRKEYMHNLWASYKTFKVNGSGYDGVNAEVFSRYEFVYLKQPESAKPAANKAKGKSENEDFDPWIGRITVIKAVAPTNVCIAIQWVYSSLAQLLEAGVSKKDLPVLYGNEVVMGLQEFEYQDLQSHSTVSDHARVLEYDEQDPLQDLIEFDAFFYRSRLMFAKPIQEDDKTGKGKRKADAGSSRLVVEPFKEPSCTCKQPYQTWPLGPATAMVFCPRDWCHRWYHIACLDPPSPATTESMLSLITSRYDPSAAPQERRATGPIKARKTKSSSKVSKASIKATEAKIEVVKPMTPEATPQPTSLPVDTLPTDVIHYAKSHVIRGDTNNGIVGNGGVVLGARAIIAAGPDERKSLLAAWLTQYGPGEDGEHWEGVHPESPSAELSNIKPSAGDQVYRCPHCDHVI